jgi:hypothetical protein
MIDDPITNPAAWSSMKVGGTPTPGKCIVSAERVYRINKMMGLGADGASTVFVGRQIVEAKATFWAWQVDHFTAWDALKVLLTYEPTKGTPVRAVDIYHPAIADLGVRAMLVEKLSTWTHEGKGLYSRTLDLVEYKPVPKTAAYGKPFSAPGDDPQTDLAVQVRQNTVDALLQHGSLEAYKP